jgi:hypothetical protein
MNTYKNIYIKTALFNLKSNYNQTNVGLYRDQSSVLERRRTLELDITKADLTRHITAQCSF